MKIFWKIVIALLVVIVAAVVIFLLRPPIFADITDATPEDTTETTVTNREHPDGRSAELLSAFFGLDSSLPSALYFVSGESTGGKDGMPVVFSHELDMSTLQAGDFKVTTESGKVGEVSVVSLSPANDPGEWRTVLLIGEYGSAEDQPAEVEIVGNLLSIDGEINFKGTRVGVVRLEDGPSIALAQIVPAEQWRAGEKATLGPGGGSGAHPDSKQVVRVTWEGGVTKPGGKDVDDSERLLYRVTVQKPDGSTEEVTPFALEDRGDMDNNHLLCLDVEGVPVSVFFPAGHVTDPREDLNPDTNAAIIPLR